MKVKKTIVGPVETNCYLVLSGDELAIVDPGSEAEKIITEVEKLGKVEYKYILLTHGHFDHIMAVNELKEKYNRLPARQEFKIVISEKDKNVRSLNKEIEVEMPDIKPDILVPAEGATLCIGKKEIKIIETPGHTKGSVSYLIGSDLFSGDTLFCHNHGRTDLLGGSDEDMKESLEKLLKLNKDIKVYPGHGPETTIREERMRNGESF